MSSQNAPWQVFADNGEPLADESASPDDFKLNSRLIQAASHVWLVRVGDNGDTEILLQKRSSNVQSWPGYYDISAAGHVDKGETFLQAAIRECKEEIGLDLTADDLHFIFSLRTHVGKKEFDTVYLVMVDENKDFLKDTDEVEQLLWLSLKEFEAWVDDTESYRLVAHSEDYFSLLLKNIRRFVDENHQPIGTGS